MKSIIVLVLILSAISVACISKEAPTQVTPTPKVTTTPPPAVTETPAPEEEIPVVTETPPEELIQEPEFENETIDLGSIL
jgi:PBP1b-binding outer membrane lipoprotein LpoB